uniref:Uncharacterized protein n=1 Tax=Caenorhabditis japonica TaxID=281687 RepID=A0A8R1J2D3_CAEJA
MGNKFGNWRAKWQTATGLGKSDQISYWVADRQLEDNSPPIGQFAKNVLSKKPIYATVALCILCCIGLLQTYQLLSVYYERHEVSEATRSQLVDFGV